MAAEVTLSRLALITGKGGVGKTAVAAAMARAVGQRGARVLAAEISTGAEDYSPLARCFGAERLPLDPGLLDSAIPTVRGVQLQSFVGMQQFITAVVKNNTLAKAASSSSALQKLMNAAPSFREMGLFYHLLTLLKQRERDGSPTYQHIVVDMPATGHTLALTGLPAKLQEVFPFGPVREALAEGQALIYNPAVTRAYPVGLPEPLVVTETLELVAALAEHRIAIGAVILNRRLENPFAPEELAAIDEFHKRRPLLGAVTASSLGLAEAATARLAAGVPTVITLPFFDLLETELQGQLAMTLASMLAPHQEAV